MRRPLVLAHRGASRAAAENTPEAFRLALAMGADGVELDVRRAGRGQLVVVHDPVVGGMPVRRQAEPALPGLGEALAAGTGGIVNVELKTDGDTARGVAAAFCGFLRRRAANGRLIVSSFDPVALRAVRALRPQLPRALVIEHAADVESALREVELAGHRALHAEAALVDAALLARARGPGIELHAWTVNEPDELERLARLGVDGLITDVPDVALAVLT